VGTTVWAEWLPGDRRAAVVYAYYDDTQFYHVDWIHSRAFCHDLRSGHPNEDKFKRHCQRRSWEMWHHSSHKPCGQYVPSEAAPKPISEQNEFDSGADVFLGLGIAVATFAALYGLYKWIQSVAHERAKYQNGGVTPERGVAAGGGGKAKQKSAFGTGSPGKKLTKSRSWFGNLEASFTWNKTLSPLKVAGKELDNLEDLEGAGAGVGGNNRRPSLWEMAQQKHGASSSVHQQHKQQSKAQPAAALTYSVPAAAHATASSSKRPSPTTSSNGMISIDCSTASRTPRGGHQESAAQLAILNPLKLHPSAEDTKRGYRFAGGAGAGLQGEAQQSAQGGAHQTHHQKQTQRTSFGGGGSRRPSLQSNKRGIARVLPQSGASVASSRRPSVESQPGWRSARPTQPGAGGR